MTSSKQDLPNPYRRHWEMLIVACLVVFFAFVFKVRDDDQVAVSGLSAYPLPPMCLSYAWFGVRCPGCGLTRSFVQLAHGNWTASVREHRLGWLLALAVLLQFPYRITALVRRTPAPLGKWLPQCIAYGLIIALIGNWLVEMAFRLPS